MWICLALWKTSRKGKRNTLGIALTTFCCLLTVKISENMALKFFLLAKVALFLKTSKPTSVNIKEVVPLDFLPEQKFFQGRYERMPGFILFSVFFVWCHWAHAHTHTHTHTTMMPVRNSMLMISMSQHLMHWRPHHFIFCARKLYFW